MRSLIVYVFATCFLYLCFGREATVGYGGMAGSSHYLATEAAINILEQGGNAADAAIALQLVLNMVQPMKSGIGGGSLIMYYDSSLKKVYAIDAREEAPNAFHGKVFCKNPLCELTDECECGGTMSSSEKRHGGLSVGTPGTFYGLYRLYKYFGGGKTGNIEWNKLFEDAISYGRDGFPMYSELYNNIRSSTCLRQFDASKELFLDDNNNPKANIDELFYNQDLANTLESLSVDADIGLGLFYTGSIGNQIIDTVQSTLNEVSYNGQTYPRKGLMTEEDLAGYLAVFREPTYYQYNDDEDEEFNIYGMNMPSSGSATVSQAMGLMNNWIDDHPELDIKNIDPSSDLNIHLLITANNAGFSDRNQYFADSDFIDVPVDGLLDDDYIKQRSSDLFSLNKVETPIPFGIPPGATNENIYNQTSMFLDEEGTTHFFVVDNDNNMVSFTTTLEGNFGSCVVVPNNGFLLNNQLTDFNSLLYDENDGKLIANGPEGGKKIRRSAINEFELNDQLTFGGKRPRSSMAPLIVLDGDNNAIYSVGSPGGSTIIGTVFNVLYNTLIHDIDVQQAIDYPRIWSQNGATISIESGIITNNPSFYDSMGLRGYSRFSFLTSSNGRCHAVKTIKNNIIDSNVEWINYGGADSNRWSTASVVTACEGDSWLPPQNDESQYCKDIFYGYNKNKNILKMNKAINYKLNIVVIKIAIIVYTALYIL